MRELLCNAISQTVEKITGTELTPELLEFPSDDAHGDLALPCFAFAKNLKTAPAKIAEQIRNALTAQMGGKIRNIEKMEIAGGYLNFFVNRAAISKFLIEKTNEAYKPLSGKTVLLEHTSINPNASPHIGRARNAFIGDAVARLFRYLGAVVEVHYFVNDIGKQISLLVWALRDRGDITFDGLLREYVTASEQLKTHPEIEKQVFDQLAKLEAGDKEMQLAFRRIVDICIEGQTKLFSELGINYDFFDFESQYIINGETGRTIERCKQSPRMFEDEHGRCIMNLEGYNAGQDMFPLTRGDKTSLYPLRDICYNIEKADKKPDTNIVVLGEDQIMYLKQINAVLDILGYPPVIGVHYSFVLLHDGKMSTRAGNVVLLSEIMEKVAEKAGSKEVGYGAMKYAILKCSANKNVLFDWDAVLNMNGDSSVYLQYQYARIASIIRKSDAVQITDYEIFNNDTTWRLFKKVRAFPSLLIQTTKSFAVSDIANYLFALAQLFSKWYTEIKIAGTQNIWLCSLVGQTLKSGLEILGIDVLESM